MDNHPVETHSVMDSPTSPQPDRVHSMLLTSILRTSILRNEPYQRKCALLMAHWNEPVRSDFGSRVPLNHHSSSFLRRDRLRNSGSQERPEFRGNDSPPLSAPLAFTISDKLCILHLIISERVGTPFAYRIVEVVDVHAAANSLRPEHLATLRVVLLVLIEQPAGDGVDVRAEVKCGR